MSRFEKFAQECFNSLSKHLANYEDKKESEALHQIRVDIKKIKSILLFANDRIKGFKAHKNYIPFRTIFRRAGEIREPEVVSGLLLAHNIPGVHDQFILGNNEKLVAKFCEDIPSYIDIVEKHWTNLKSTFKTLEPKDLRKFLRKTKKGLKSKMYPIPDMHLIHRVRKSIKAFIYLSGANRHREKKLIKFYLKEVEAIGQLHDRQVLLTLMEKQNGAADKTLIKKIQQECSNLRTQITKKAMKYYRA